MIFMTTFYDSYEAYRKVRHLNKMANKASNCFVENVFAFEIPHTPSDMFDFSLSGRSNTDTFVEEIDSSLDSQFSSSSEVSNEKAIYGEDFSYDLLSSYINEPAVHKKLRQICYKASTLEGYNLLAWLLKAITFIDLTALGSNETADSINELCEKAINPIKLPFYWTEPLSTAAVCIYPTRIKTALDALNNKNRPDIAVAVVGGGFPSGQYPLKSRLLEVRFLAQTGANEIDVVINRSLAITHQWKELYNEIKALRKACDKVCMKTILGTGELYDLNDIYKASMTAMLAGADFIKTSTGKEAVNATLPAGIAMCRAIKDFYRRTGRKVGLKPAGGIKTTKDALQWMVLVKEELGDEWLNKKLFRIGASSLLDNIVAEVNSRLIFKDSDL